MYRARARIAVVLVVGGVLFGQASTQVKFDVAAIRRVNPDAQRLTGSRYGPQGVLLRGITIRALIMNAYGVKAFQVAGPDNLDRDTYEVSAKVPIGSTQVQVNVMLQNLLTERFDLVFHHERREYSVYHLQLTDGGAKLAKYASSRTGRGEIEEGVKDGVARVQVRSAMMEGLTKSLARQLDLPVFDKTGLTGNYTFTMEFASEKGFAGQKEAAAVDVPAPSIYTVLRDQLGLHVAKTRDMIDTLVVDSIAKAPSDN